MPIAVETTPPAKKTPSPIIPMRRVSVSVERMSVRQAIAPRSPSRHSSCSSVRSSLFSGLRHRSNDPDYEPEHSSDSESDLSTSGFASIRTSAAHETDASSASAKRSKGGRNYVRKKRCLAGGPLRPAKWFK